MANKANVNRKRIMRSVVLSASMLSLIPLVGVMQSASSKSDSGVVAGISAAGETLAPSSSTSATNTQAGTTASAATAKQTTSATQSTAASSYTRTRAS